MCRLLDKQLEPEVLNSIVAEAVEIEREFICESLPCNLIGMNADYMKARTALVLQALSVHVCAGGTLHGTSLHEREHCMRQHSWQVAERSSFAPLCRRCGVGVHRVCGGPAAVQPRGAEDVQHEQPVLVDGADLAAVRATSLFCPRLCANSSYALGQCMACTCVCCTFTSSRYVQTLSTACRGKTNFFERRVGEYQKSSVMAGLAGGVHEFSTDVDF